MDGALTAAGGTERRDAATLAEDAVDRDLATPRRIGDQRYLRAVLNRDGKGVGVAVGDREEAKVGGDEDAHDPKRLPLVGRAEIAENQEEVVQSEDQIEQEGENARKGVALRATDRALLAGECVELRKDCHKLRRLDLAFRLEIVETLGENHDHRQEGPDGDVVVLGGDQFGGTREDRRRRRNRQHLKVNLDLAVVVLDHVRNGCQNQPDLGSLVGAAVAAGVVDVVEVAAGNQGTCPDGHIDTSSCEIPKVTYDLPVSCQVVAQTQRDEEHDHRAERTQHLPRVQILDNPELGTVDILEHGHRSGCNCGSEERGEDDGHTDVDEIALAEIGVLHAQTPCAIIGGRCVLQQKTLGLAFHLHGSGAPLLLNTAQKLTLFYSQDCSAHTHNFYSCQLSSHHGTTTRGTRRTGHNHDWQVSKRPRRFGLVGQGHIGIGHITHRVLDCDRSVLPARP